jgi:hypothetical protein
VGDGGYEWRCVMLTSDKLRYALTEAQRKAGVCTRFCAVDGACGASEYTIWHNGLGSSDSSKQRVYAKPVLTLPLEYLIEWLVDWFVLTHKRQHLDLNTVRGATRHAL